MNFKADLIEALTDTVTHQSKSINALLVNGDRLQQVIDEQADEIARLKRLSDEQSKVINEFRNGF